MSGSYDNFGIWDDGDRVVLAQVFFPLTLSDNQMLNYELLAVSHITLTRQASDTYVIEAMVGEELLMRREPDAAELGCRDSRVIMHSTEWSLGGVPPFLPVVTHDSINRTLSLASDGSLVIENEVLSSGAALIVPLVMRGQNWQLFAPATTAMNEYPNRPRGVRTGSGSGSILLAPDSASDWSGWQVATQCSDAASDQSWSPPPELSDGLGDHSTQVFILQDGKDGAVRPSGDVADNDWHPADHNLRIEKQHWLPPEFADRYVMCLLERGYQWGEINSAVAQ